MRFESHPQPRRSALRRALAAAPGLALLAALGCEGPPPITGERRDEPLESAILDDALILRIRLPPGYDDDPARRYPVVYQLDPTFGGLEQFAITAGYVSTYEETGEAPAAIVVGIDYEDPSRRHRDYAPPAELDPAYGSDGADRFYRVLRDEVVPHIDLSLRTDVDRRYLVGHSRGGYFALYAALRHDPAAPLLAGVVANDPSYSQDLLTYEGWLAARSDALPLRIYRAIAAANGPVQALAHRWIGERLADHGYDGLVDRAEVFDTDHGGIIEPGAAAGLLFVLGGAP